MEKRTYEISNPSDAYTMQASDLKVAQMATLLLGQGAYGLQDADGNTAFPIYGNTALPIFLFGGGKEFPLREFGVVGPWIDANRDALVDALESVQIGGISERRELDDALSCMATENRAEYLKRRHDRLRTSQNNIGQAAWDLAARLRERKVSQ